MDYCGVQASSTLPFEFPPGHRIRIRKFVGDVRNLVCKQASHSKLRNKRKRSSVHSADKRAKQTDTTTSSDNDSESEDTIDSIATNINSSIVKWTKAQTVVRLRNLCENKHYSVVVKKLVKKAKFSVQVTCLGCRKPISLQRKDSSNKCSPYIISNWTRHIKKCDKQEQETSHQFSLFSHGFT